MILPIKQTFKLNPETEDKLKTATRKDAIFLLILLNTYGDYDVTMLKIRKEMLNEFHPLPEVGTPNYKRATVTRSYFMKRYKDLYRDYIVKA